MIKFGTSQRNGVYVWNFVPKLSPSNEPPVTTRGLYVHPFTLSLPFRWLYTTKVFTQRLRLLTLSQNDPERPPDTSCMESLQGNLPTYLVP